MLTIRLTTLLIECPILGNLEPKMGRVPSWALHPHPILGTTNHFCQRWAEAHASSIIAYWLDKIVWNKRN